MSPSSAVVASVFIITTTTIIRRIRTSKPGQSHQILESIVFGFLLLIALLTLAIIMPTFAKVLAYLGMVGAFVLNGPTLFKFVGDFGRGQGRI